MGAAKKLGYECYKVLHTWGTLVLVCPAKTVSPKYHGFWVLDWKCCASLLHARLAALHACLLEAVGAVPARADGRAKRHIVKVSNIYHK